MFRYDALVYLGLVSVVAALGVGAFVIKNTPETADPEARRIRFAAATSAGLLMLLVFACVLYFADSNGPGKDIFEKAFGFITTLAGTLVGYVFGVKTSTKEVGRNPGELVGENQNVRRET